MSDDSKTAIDALLDQVNPARRNFLRRLLAGGAALGLAAPVSALLAQEPEAPADGKGKRGGRDGERGKGKGDGEGKGRGDGGGKGKRGGGAPRGGGPRGGGPRGGRGRGN
ncbi:MAG TPA: hypothetical protein VFR18_04515 [Terriglobia bacterium]|nr:hypothetical protein [Terriglobia bacterium]